VRSLRALPRAPLALGAAFGVVLGLGLYTLAYGEGLAYLSDDPRACANCHVMREQYEGWQKGSHRTAATCNDCHVPHDFLGRWWIKARNGFWHSYYFTSGTFKEPIRATPVSRKVAEANCRRCHEAVVQAMGTPSHAGSDEISCIRCHSSVGHMEVGATSVAAAGR
jgi:cytochrome c nitrite reductase small subunit